MIRFGNKGTRLNKNMFLIVQKDLTEDVDCECRFNKNGTCTITSGVFPCDRNITDTMFSLGMNDCLLKFKDEKEMYATVILGDIM